MSEMVPSVLLYGQAMAMLEELKEMHSADATQNTFDLISQLSEILTRFEEFAGRPLVDYELVAPTEPPSSEKSNRFWRAAEQDVNLLQQQTDVLRAASIFSHNLIVTEVLSAQNNNSRLRNKLKSLQMYSNNSDSSIITFGDSFKNFEFVDLSLIPEANKPTLFHEGHVTLGQEGEMINLSPDADIKVLSSSNGFLGNNQEIEDPNSATIDPNTDQPNYEFKAETDRRADLNTLKDGEPDTWIEYESYELSAAQKRSALNYNFTYSQQNDDDTTSRVEWATKPSNSVLELGLEFDLKRIKNINSIEFTPYGLENNVNDPILIRQVQTSSNGTDWESLYPSSVWIANDINLNTARFADNIVSRRAIWTFQSRGVRYVRMYVEQPRPIACNVGHIYWIDRHKREDSIRKEGPIPPVSDPTVYNDRAVVGDLVQRREFFPAKRWAIGIRDILLQQVEYTTKSVLVSKPLRVGGLVDRVMLESADFQIPIDYPTTGKWVRFFVSPDEGENWFEISRIEDPNGDVPEQISFNDPIHDSLRESSVINYNIDKPVTSIRFKVEMSRPSDKKSTTPVLRSYVLKVKRR